MAAGGACRYEVSNSIGVNLHRLLCSISLYALVSNSIGVNLHIMANFEETSIGLFQTPAEEIYTQISADWALAF